MISIDKLTIRFGGVPLFSEISLLINPKDRIGLVGKNGAGKTTLLKVLYGLQKSDEGQVTQPEGITLGYLPQEMKLRDEHNLYDEASKAFDEVIHLENEIANLNQQITERTDYESEEYLALCDRLAEKSDHLHIVDGGKRSEKIEQTLKGLGFQQNDFNKPTSTFSGGWRMRIELAKVLLRHPNVLLLDEPTNHLDIESIQWLEDFLKNYPGAVVLISHDRAFLDAITNRTVEISLGKIYDFNVPYSKYVEERKIQRENQLATYKNQQKKIEDTREFIDRFRYKATKAVQVQSRIKQLEKMDVVEVEEEDKASINIRFPDAPRSGREVYKAKNLTKKYGDKLVLDAIDFVIERGEKIAFVGKNGEGKSTLSKIITGETEHTGGESIPGHNVNLGYFAQNQDERLNENNTVFETIDKIAVGDVRTRIRDILGAFLFSGEDVDKKVKVLSGGEKSRLAMASLMLEPYNFLVLDEPTNHLDMRSKDILKQALQNYNGSLIIVSHDRDFLQGLTSKVYEFKNHKIHENIGDIKNFLERKKLEHLKDLEKAQHKSGKKQVAEAKQPSNLDYEERRALERDIRKAANKVRETEEKIENTEKSIQEYEAIMARPEKLNALEDQDKFYQQYNAKKKELEEFYNSWEKYTEILNELEIKKGSSIE
ncbi:MAG: ATP-binding cassette domain-containing protein [Bacteroidetes bacterium]|jgi:ATP-binding cassette subfamily F protein 3|nr:ATP-binding cassette domain-containing protein [Bacteroidota bacterium]